MHHGLHSSADRSKPSQPQQVQRRCSQRGHRAGAIAAVPVGVLMELGVADPLPPFNAPAVPYQLQQAIWVGVQAGEEPMGGLKWLAIAAAVGGHFDDPAGADPGLGDVLRRLFRARHPGDGTAVADLVIGCHKRDLAFSLNWQRIWRWRVFWFALTVRRKSAPCSWSCRKTVSECAGQLLRRRLRLPPGSARPPDSARQAAA